MESDGGDDVRRFECLAIFHVRLDKTRGILIESFEHDDNVFFFKFQDQPILRHCIQMQQIVGAANVKRAKKITIDITDFMQEYILGGKHMFKGTLLNSVQQQINKTCELTVNKEIGAIKRRETYAGNKQKRIEVHNEKILAKYRATELMYQKERERKLDELFGSGAQRSETRAEARPATMTPSAYAPVPVCKVAPLGPRQRLVALPQRPVALPQRPVALPQHQVQQQNNFEAMDVDIPDDDDDL